MVWVIAILTLILAIVVAEVVANWWSIRVMLPMIDIAPPFRVEKISPNDEGELIEFPSTHGLTLRGSLYRHEDQPSRGLIVFCHEYGSNHWSALSYCEGLWEAGFDILAFDFRNQGESDSMPDYEPIHWLTDYEVQDVLSALRYVDSRDDLNELPVGLFGISRGGCAALAATALSPHVDCVAADGAFIPDDVIWHHCQRWLSLYVAPWILRWIPDWHIRMTLQLARWISQHRRGCHFTSFDRLIPRLRTKNLSLIFGANDKYVISEIAQSLRRKAGHNEQCMWCVPEAKHNMCRQVALREYDSRLIEFFFDALVATRPMPVRQSQPTG